MRDVNGGLRAGVVGKVRLADGQYVGEGLMEIGEGRCDGWPG